MALARYKQDWEELGKMDPLWAVLTYPDQKFGKWSVDQLFSRGEQELARVMEVATHLGYPTGREVALGFGCGVGRRTKALAKHFQKCYSVGVSESMITTSRELNGTIAACEFLVNTEGNLRIFPKYFDMVYSYPVLQHIPSRGTIKSYISEFVRTLKENGLLVFQLFSYVPLKDQLQPCRRVYSTLRTLGFSERFVHERLGVHPIRANFFPEKEVLAFLHGLGRRF